MNENERMDEDLDDAGGAYAGGGYTGGYASGFAAGAGGEQSIQSPEEIERQIEATRSRMTRDIDAIGNKLHPRNLAAQAGGKVTEQVRDTGRGFLDLIRENPLPAAAVGASVAWLVSRSRSEGPFTRRLGGGYGYGGDTRFGAGYGYGGFASEEYTGAERRLGGDAYGEEFVDDSPGAVERAKEKARHAAETVAQKARGLTSRAGDVAEHAKERVVDVAEHTKERVGGIAEQAKRRVTDLGYRSKDLVQRSERRVTETWGQARTTLDRQTHENPLLVAAGAAVLGLALGWLLPVTRKENELLGHVRDDVLDRASTAAERVKDVAAESAREVADTVKSEAQNRVPEIKRLATDIGNQVKDQVKDAAGKVTQEAKNAVKNSS